MKAMRRSRTAKRAALLASTAVIALLSACQGSGGNAVPSATAPAAVSSGDKTPAGGSY